MKNREYYNGAAERGRSAWHKDQDRSVEEYRFFGPGLFHLLQYIDEEGTIHAASKKMGMSYSKCWKLLNRAEEQMEFTFLDRYNGGPHGGNSRITEEGREFMRRYEALLEEMKEISQKAFEKYFKEYFKEYL